MEIKVALIAVVIFFVLTGLWLLRQPVVTKREENAPLQRNDPFEKKPIHHLDGFLEAVVCTAIGLCIWGLYGFPHFVKVALGCIAFSCVIAFMWKRDML